MNPAVYLFVGPAEAELQAVADLSLSDNHIESAALTTLLGNLQRRHPPEACGDYPTGSVALADEIAHVQSIPSGAALAPDIRLYCDRVNKILVYHRAFKLHTKVDHITVLQHAFHKAESTYESEFKAAMIIRMKKNC
jgi:hypothetical protein